MTAKRRQEEAEILGETDHVVSSEEAEKARKASGIESLQDVKTPAEGETTPVVINWKPGGTECLICHQQFNSTKGRNSHARREHPNAGVPELGGRSLPSAVVPADPQYSPEIQAKLLELAPRFYQRISSLPFRLAKMATGSAEWSLTEEEAEDLRQDVELLCIVWGLPTEPKMMTLSLVTEDYLQLLPRKFRAYKAEQLKKLAEQPEPEKPSDEQGQPFKN